MHAPRARRSERRTSIHAERFAPMAPSGPDRPTSSETPATLLAQQLADLERLHDMTMRLSTTLELEPILCETLTTAVALVGADMGLVALCDQQQNYLKIGANLG